MRISAGNQIRGTVTAITDGSANANVEVKSGDSRLVASITVESRPSREPSSQQPIDPAAHVAVGDVAAADDEPE